MQLPFLLLKSGRLVVKRWSRPCVVDTSVLLTGIAHFSKSNQLATVFTLLALAMNSKKTRFYNAVMFCGFLELSVFYIAIQITPSPFALRLKYRILFLGVAFFDCFKSLQQYLPLLLSLIVFKPMDLLVFVLCHAGSLSDDLLESVNGTSEWSLLVPQRDLMIQKL